MRHFVVAAVAAVTLGMTGAALADAPAAHRAPMAEQARNSNVLPSQRPAYLAKNDVVLPSQRPAYLA